MRKAQIKIRDACFPRKRPFTSPFDSTYFSSRKKNLVLNKWLHIAMRLLSNRSQITSKCGENKKRSVTHSPQVSVSLISYQILTSFVIALQRSLVRLDCSRICASLGISTKSPSLRLVSASFFLSYRTCEQPVYRRPPSLRKRAGGRLHTV